MAVYLCDNNPHKYTDPGNGDLSEAFKPLTDFFENTEKQARQLPNDLKATSKVVGDGLVEGGRIAGEATAESLGTASTVTGLIPGGQVASLVLAGADAFVNDTMTSTTSATASALTDTAATDITSNSGKVMPTNKVKAAIYVVSQVVGIFGGSIQADNEAKNIEVEKDEK